MGSLIKVLLGLLLVGLAVRDFRKRPRPGEQPPLPGWMRAIDSITGAKALGIAILLSALNPKNLSLTAAAAVTVAQEGLSTILTSHVALAAAPAAASSSTFWFTLVLLVSPIAFPTRHSRRPE